MYFLQYLSLCNSTAAQGIYHSSAKRSAVFYDTKACAQLIRY